MSDLKQFCSYPGHWIYMSSTSNLEMKVNVKFKFELINGYKASTFRQASACNEQENNENLHDKNLQQ